MPLSEAVQEELNFRDELKKLLNKHSRENSSGTPDFILANFLARCLDAYDQTLIEREQFYGRATNPTRSV
jgi:hypothetical protein